MMPQIGFGINNHKKIKSETKSINCRFKQNENPAPQFKRSVYQRHR